MSESNVNPNNGARIVTVIFIVTMIILFISIWNSDHPNELPYTGGGYSSLVLEFPRGTSDWKEWKGKTYCFIDKEWHECEPQLANTNLRSEK